MTLPCSPLIRRRLPPQRLAHLSLGRRKPSGRRRKRRSDAHGSFEIVARLQDLQAQVARQRRATREELVDLRECLLRVLAADETAQPGANEEDAPVLLEPGQAVERRDEIR